VYQQSVGGKNKLRSYQYVRHNCEEKTEFTVLQSAVAGSVTKCSGRQCYKVQWQAALQSAVAGSVTKCSGGQCYKVQWQAVFFPCIILYKFRTHFLNRMCMNYLFCIVSSIIV